MSMVPKQRGPFPKRKRYENEAYRRYVASQPCMACGYHETQAAHISVGNFARGMKADDYYCIPLCGLHMTATSNGLFSCHVLFDQNQKRFARKYLGKSIEELKAEAKASWQQWLSEAA